MVVSLLSQSLLHRCHTAVALKSGLYEDVYLFKQLRFSKQPQYNCCIAPSIVDKELIAI